ncbi:MAG: hypothetical protein WC292_04905 [Clostridia bacterium]
MKKDYLIKKKLDRMADEIRPPDRVLSGARRAIAENNERQAARQPKRFRAVAAFAAVVIIAVVSVLIYNNVNKDSPLAPNGDQSPSDSQQDATPPPSYKLSELSGRLAGEQDISEITIFDLGDNTAQFYRVYQDKKTGETAVTITKVKSITPQGMDEVLIFADLGGGLQDLQSLKTSGNIYQKGEQKITYTERYEDGEWYTQAYYNKDDTDYYLMIMSPTKGIGEYYFTKIL